MFVHECTSSVVVTAGAPTNCKGRLFWLNTELSRTALGQFKQKAIIPAFIYLFTSISLSLVGRKIYEIGHFVTMPTACEVAEARIARTETRSITLEAFSIVVPPRNFELCVCTNKRMLYNHPRDFSCADANTKKRLRPRGAMLWGQCVCVCA